MKRTVISNDGENEGLFEWVCVSVNVKFVCIVGLWLEAAELIWASLIGFYALPQPDKKVWTPLSLLLFISVCVNTSHALDSESVAVVVFRALERPSGSWPTHCPP